MSPVPSHSTFTWTDHSIPGLVCTPAKVSSVVLFFLINYVAHCATVKTFPAETPKEIAIAIVGALLFPSSGLSRALDAIRRRPRLRKLNSLEQAAQAGALCMVVRTPEWQPREGDVIRHIRSSPPEVTRKVSDSSSEPKHEILHCKILTPPWTKEFEYSPEPCDSILQRKCKIHSVYQLPEGYEFAYVPRDAIISPNGTQHRRSKTGINLVTSSSLVKTCLALLQTGYATFSVYRARGDQINLYGYAAPGLSVIPYITMSVLNLIAQAVSHDYPMLYMVSNAEMDEATSRGGIFRGAVARLEPWDGGIDKSKEEVWIPTNSGPWIVDHGNSDGAWNIHSQHPDNTPIPLQMQIELLPYGRTDVYIPTCSKFQRTGQTEKTQLLANAWKQHSRSSRRNLQDKWFRYTFFAPLGLSLISFSLLGGLSKFRHGIRSTSTERGFMLSWLVSGMLFGVLTNEALWVVELSRQGILTSFRKLGRAIKSVKLRGYGVVGDGDSMMVHTKFTNSHRARLGIKDRLEIAVRSTVASLMIPVFVMIVLVSCVPAVGGFVMVGRIILEYGDCTRIT